MPSTRTAVVKVAHENALIEAGLRYVLGTGSEFRVQPPESGNPVPAREAPDVVVLDHGSGLRWARSHPHGAGGSARIMIVSLTMDSGADVREAFEAGVDGYVDSRCSADEIVSAARAVAHQRRYLCGSAALRMTDSLLHATLTPREREVLVLVSRGLCNKEVARELGISLGTVKSHMRTLLSKLDARCRTEALWVASQRGLLSRPDGLSQAHPATAKAGSTDRRQ